MTKKIKYFVVEMVLVTSILINAYVTLELKKYGEYQITGDSCSTVEPKPGVTWIYVICLLSVVILLSSLYLLAYIFIETEHCECYQELVDEDNSLNVVDVFDEKVD